jgi:hypothetical protein
MYLAATPHNSVELKQQQCDFYACSVYQPKSGPDIRLELRS